MPNNGTKGLFFRTLQWKFMYYNHVPRMSIWEKYFKRPAYLFLFLMKEIEDSTTATNPKCKSCENPPEFTCKYCSESVCEAHARKKHGRSRKQFYICQECYKTDEMLPKIIMLIACSVILIIFVAIPLPLERIWMVAIPIVMGLGAGGFALAIFIQDKRTRIQPLTEAK